MEEITGKVAVVTGGGSGIGRGIALALGGAGMTVVVADLDRAAAEATCRQLAAQGATARAFRVDVADAHAMEVLAGDVEATVGPPAVLCNNAGVAVAGLLDATPEDWRWLLDVNVMGVVNGCRAFVPRMIARGAGGHVVNTASIGGFLSGPDLGVYCTTKYAIVGFSEALRLELMAHGIGVTVLCPGAYRTGIAAAARGRHGRYGAGASELPGLREMTDAGDDPATIGPHVLRAIRTDAPYAFTHTMFRPLVESRFASVLAAFDDAG